MHFDEQLDMEEQLGKMIQASQSGFRGVLQMLPGLEIAWGIYSPSYTIHFP